MSKQLNLFEAVQEAYSRGIENNDELYKFVAFHTNTPSEEMNKLEPIGEDGRMYSKLKRKIRWIQQELKQQGLLEKKAQRGMWTLTQEGKAKIELHKVNDDFQLLAFSTKFGFAIWGDARAFFEKSTEPIHLLLSSPPYPILTNRAYGGIKEKEYVDWLCYMLEPLIKNLHEGGSVVLNIGNDVNIMRGSPAKSLYKERLVIALSDRLGLSKIDEIPWINLSKIPSNAWSTQKKQLMLPAWEPILWFSNNPGMLMSDATRILKPHTQAHLKYMQEGGSKKEYINGDGAYHVKKGSFANDIGGALPRNVYIRGHKSAENIKYQEICKQLGIPKHSAMFPVEMASHLIEFLTIENQLVVDPFFGRGGTGLAANKLKRKWVGSDIIWEYLRGGGECFDEVEFNNDFLGAIAC